MELLRREGCSPAYGPTVPCFSVVGPGESTPQPWAKRLSAREQPREQGALNAVNARSGGFRASSSSSS